MDTLAKISILVIDDNIDMLNWFKLLNTATSPYHFYTLQNELMAAQAMQNVKPVLIFLDISLNTLDGPLVASILNGNNYEEWRIIPMSAEPKFKKAINSDNFLLKPLTKEVVFAKINELLKKS
jgi:two-component SAPR family response regulator